MRSCPRQTPPPSLVWSWTHDLPGSQQTEKTERSSLQKLALMRKLAGTTWDADSSILTKVYAATACTPSLPSWQLSFQYPSSGCLLMWDWREMKQQTDLLKSAVGLRRHRTLSPIEAKTLLHSQYNGDWKKENDGYQARLDLIWRPE